jgi:molybdate-binding protein/DNA-binding XRE family transcriptional regulator
VAERPFEGIALAKSSIENRLGQIRQSRGIGASDLARRVNVSRQTIYAIEAGTFVPNTEVALLLARELEVPLDELFSLSPASPRAAKSLAAEVLSAEPPVSGQPVRVCQIGSRWVGVPVTATPYYLPEADGIIRRAGRESRRADIMVFAAEELAQKRLTLAGCDPATSLLSKMVEKMCGVEVVSAAASSKLAMTWLKEGKVHIAGSHLEDPETGEFNLPYVRRNFPGEDMMVVTFARWEEGLVVGPGNPKKIRGPADLARKGVRIVNREPGAGSRALLDKLLDHGGIAASRIAGYDRIAYGHLAAAYAVVSGDAEACLATRSAAQTFGLDFVPLHTARYDLVMRKRTADLPAVKAFLDVLQRATLRRKLELLAGYDTSETGSLVASGPAPGVD